jgi:hypothetical protein
MREIRARAARKLAKRAAAVVAAGALGCSAIVGLDDYGTTPPPALDADTDAIGVPPPLEAGPVGPTVHRPCLEYLEAGFVESGFYDSSTTPPFTVFCDMDVDHGGWTLMAHSAPSVNVAFGWTSPQGTLADASMPYVLDIVDSGIGFGEVLVANLGNDLRATAHAYKFSVTSTFLSDWPDKGTRVDPIAVLGSCDAGPTMLTHTGYTSNQDCFFMRDYIDFVSYGLFSQGFELVGYKACATSGELDVAANGQGSIFIR